MLERYLEKTEFDSLDDFQRNFKIKVPEHFNFAYDVVDRWAEEQPDKPALLWTNEAGEERQFSFREMKEYSDRTASFFQSLGIGRGDMVMLILKRRYQFWFSILALHKLGAVAIPATHLLMPKDIVYRCNAAKIKAIVAVGDEVVTDNIEKALPQCPTVCRVISTGPIVPEGWEDFNKGIAEAPEFRRPVLKNRNEDLSLLYFTSGTTGEPKMVAHDFLYPLGHIITGKYWHNLDENSLHLTLADTGWGKAVWGKLYGQWFSGANVFVYDFDKFKPKELLNMFQKYHITSFCAPPTVYRFLILEDVRSYDLSEWLSRPGHESERVRDMGGTYGPFHSRSLRPDRDHADHRHLPVDDSETGFNGHPESRLSHRSAERCRRELQTRGAGPDSDIHRA